MALKNGLKGEKHLPLPPPSIQPKGVVRTVLAAFSLLCSLHYLGRTGFASKKAHIFLSLYLKQAKVH
jgi:hypothetical protein